MSAQEFQKWQKEHLEWLRIFHAEKQKLLGQNAPKRYTN